VTSLVERLRRSHPMSGRTIGASVLGLIVSAAIMAAAGELGSVAAVVPSVIAAAAIYWVADSYAEALASHLVSQQGFLRELLAELHDRRAVVEAAFAPVVAVLLLTAAGVSGTAAITGGLVVATALLFVYGWVGATRSGLSGLRSLLAASVIAMLGVVMVALKTWLHSPRH
jgi:hypothetical protein